MDVLTVGAGICGLTAAIALRRQGHKVTIFEQSQLAVESGAAIFLPPNANGLLRSYGFSPTEHGANRYHGHRHFTPQGELDFEELVAANEYEEPWELIRRSSLHDGLKKLALCHSGHGTPVTIRTSSRIQSVNSEKPSVVLEDGSEIESDLVLGADGSKSLTRDAVGVLNREGKLIQPFSSGKNAFRFLISRENLKRRPDTYDIYNENGILNAWFGEHSHLVSYPCEHNQLINFVAIHPNTLSNAEGNDYNAGGSKDILRNVFQDFESRIQTIIDLIEPAELKLYPLLDMESLPTFIKGRLALIGDAAHPFLPYQGQGGAQAIEDAVSIAALLPKDTKSEDIPLRLQLYEKARKERVEEVQQKTRLTGSEMAPDTSLDFKAIRDYNFNHNEWDHSTRILRKYFSQNLEP